MVRSQRRAPPFSSSGPRPTSANFSYSAENRNVEFGILVRDSALATSVEAMMTNKHGSLYELINA
ncbi:hypothetical protein HDC37_002900 [Microbacterium sp. AK009]|uniref:hypothetical protein n=1 Tax=Microbacterium sp. AK009 TaxID=2723068 RepID=UPI0017A4BB0E|nr:hypothetical protein [Microbacterium sp. AK009]NYF18044.1 hypothetical protein [Microbacterium sp. AK009]